MAKKTKKRKSTAQKRDNGATKELVRQMVAAETKKALSDPVLAQKLGVTRASIQWHRDNLGIPNAFERQARLDKRNAKKKKKR